MFRILGGYLMLGALSVASAWHEPTVPKQGAVGGDGRGGPPPKELERFPCPEKFSTNVVNAAYSPDGKQLVASFSYAGTHSSTIRIWDTQTGKLLREVPAGDNAVVSKDGRYFASYGHDGGPVRIVAIGAPGEKDFVVKTLPDAHPKRGPLGFLNDGSLVSANGTETVVWSAKTGKQSVLKGHGSTDASFRSWRVVTSADGSRVATLGLNPGARYVFGYGPDPSAIRIWDVKTGKLLRSFQDSDDHHYSDYALSPDGKTLAASNGSTIRVFDLDSGDLKGALPAGERLINQLAFSPDGNRLFWGESYFEENPGGKFHEADLRSMKVTTSRGRFPASVDWIAPSPDGRQVAVYASKEGQGCGFTLFQTGGTGATGKLAAGDFDALWKELTSADEAVGDAAARALVSPKFRKQLETKLAPVFHRSDGPFEAKMKRLVNELGSEEFQEREAALKEIGNFLNSRTNRTWFFSRVYHWVKSVERNGKIAAEDYEIEGRLKLLRTESEKHAADTPQSTAMLRLMWNLAKAAGTTDSFLTRLIAEGDPLSEVVQQANRAVQIEALFRRIDEQFRRPAYPVPQANPEPFDGGGTGGVPQAPPGPYY